MCLSPACYAGHSSVPTHPYQATLPHSQGTPPKPSTLLKRRLRTACLPFAHTPTIIQKYCAHVLHCTHTSHCGTPALNPPDKTRASKARPARAQKPGVFLRQALTSRRGRASRSRCAPASLKQEKDSTTTSSACAPTPASQTNATEAVQLGEGPLASRAAVFAHAHCLLGLLGFP